ncbi:type I toxin-antitoxin system Fst family toxin, partial [Mammaliicoccus sciuri]
MTTTFVNIIAPIICGCAIAYYSHWLEL